MEHSLLVNIMLGFKIFEFTCMSCSSFRGHFSIGSPLY
jgi:hypothetical protein